MSGRRALVTGGSGEIGGAIARRLAADGHHVVVHGHANAAAAEEIAEAITGGGGAAEAAVFDVTDADAAARALAGLLEAGPIQIVVSNAGVHDDAPLAGMSRQQWRRVIDVSLNGFYNVVQPLLLPMMRTRWGRVVTISSISAVLGNRGQANYAAAKAGLHGATRSLARECASRGVTANAVAPGVIATAGFERHFPPERVKAMVPMNRAGTPEEVAELVAFLASDRAGYITGQVIGINGGVV